MLTVCYYIYIYIYIYNIISKSLTVANNVTFLCLFCRASHLSKCQKQTNTVAVKNSEVIFKEYTTCKNSTSRNSTTHPSIHEGHDLSLQPRTHQNEQNDDKKPETKNHVELTPAEPSKMASKMDKRFQQQPFLKNDPLGTIQLNVASKLLGGGGVQHEQQQALVLTSITKTADDTNGDEASSRKTSSSSNGSNSTNDSSSSSFTSQSHKCLPDNPIMTTPTSSGAGGKTLTDQSDLFWPDDPGQLLNAWLGELDSLKKVNNDG